MSVDLTPISSVVATAALRQKKAHENELDRIAGTRLTLETQVSGSLGPPLTALPLGPTH